ncbi:MAG: hypothetical protein CK427_17215 [Leptospira sp.]|nr:MAG: hypothetical protein CK427_17215 [Leptospira sp.]
MSVAEPRRGVSVGAPSCDARSVTEDNVPLGRARAQVPSVACQPQLVAVLFSGIRLKILLTPFLAESRQDVEKRKLTFYNHLTSSICILLIAKIFTRN